MKISNNRFLMNVLKLLHLVSVVSVAGGFLSMFAILLTRDMSTFTGKEIVYDKVVLNLFNTLVTYGAFLMVITIFIYCCFTEWGSYRHC